MITVAFTRGAERYDGPLDLLLALVRQNRYPLDALPIAQITRQYDAYLKDAKQADVELGGEFIETASWLVLLKSRALLPQAPTEEAPGEELERVLLDHQTLRAAAALLGIRQLEAGVGPWQGTVSGAVRENQDRDPHAGQAEPIAAVPAAGPTVHDALLAARQALAVARAHAQGSSAVLPERYPVEEILAALEQRLATLEPGRGVSTEPWFEDLAPPEAQVTLLLALLELARLRRILLGQYKPFGAVLLKRIEE